MSPACSAICLISHQDLAHGWKYCSFLDNVRGVILESVPNGYSYKVHELHPNTSTHLFLGKLAILDFIAATKNPDKIVKFLTQLVILFEFQIFIFDYALDIPTQTVHSHLKFNMCRTELLISLFAPCQTARILAYGNTTHSCSH